MDSARQGACADVVAALRPRGRVHYKAPRIWSDENLANIRAKTSPFRIQRTAKVTRIPFRPTLSLHSKRAIREVV
eukprot:4312696-Prymnesium_polylepis.1